MNLGSVAPHLLRLHVLKQAGGKDNRVSLIAVFILVLLSCKAVENQTLGKQAISCRYLTRCVRKKGARAETPGTELPMK